MSNISIRISNVQYWGFTQLQKCVACMLKHCSFMSVGIIQRFVIFILFCRFFLFNCNCNFRLILNWIVVKCGGRHEIFYAVRTLLNCRAINFRLIANLLDVLRWNWKRFWSASWRVSPFNSHFEIRWTENLFVLTIISLTNFFFVLLFSGKRLNCFVNKSNRRIINNDPDPCIMRKF